MSKLPREETRGGCAKGNPCPTQRGRYHGDDRVIEGLDATEHGGDAKEFAVKGDDLFYNNYGKVHAL